jgi:hypothetical protein
VGNPHLLGFRFLAVFSTQSVATDRRSPLQDSAEIARNPKLGANEIQRIRKKQKKIEVRA